MSRRRTILLILFFLFLWSGCAPGPIIRGERPPEEVPTPETRPVIKEVKEEKAREEAPTPETRPITKPERAPEELPTPETIKILYETALDEYKKGEGERASKLFQELIIKHPHSSLIDDALYYIGEIYLQRGEYSAAAVQFESLLQYFPSSSKYNEAQWSLANCYYKMERYEEALKTSRQLLPSVGDQPLWRGRLFTFLGECHAAMHDPMAALSWYDRAQRGLAPDKKKEVKERITTLLDQDLPPDKYKEIDIIYGGTFIATYARYRLAQLLFREGRIGEAADVLRGTLQESAEEEFYPLLEDLWKKIQKVVKEEVVLGCILPLQGKARPFGMRALHGIQLAIGAFRPQEWPFKVRLIIWDSQGDPSRAKEGVKVMAKEGVMAIIGPLLSHTAIAAAEEAEVQEVPLMTLSPLKGIAQKGMYVFQNSLTHACQVRALVKYALEELNIFTYAILYPRNPYGLTFRRLFQQEVEINGGELIVAASYSDRQTDFGDIIKGMVKYKPSEDPKEKPKPIINFGAIFIPDDFKKINLLAPQLAYYDITGIQLLGTNGWNSIELIRNSREFVEGAIFVDGFFKDSPLPWVRYFAAEFEETFHYSPTLLEALSYDSTDVILKAISDRELWGRKALCKALLSLKEYLGVSGLKGFSSDSDGEGIRNPFLLTVSHGRIRQILSPE